MGVITYYLTLFLAWHNAVSLAFAPELLHRHSEHLPPRGSSAPGGPAATSTAVSDAVGSAVDNPMRVLASPMTNMTNGENPKILRSLASTPPSATVPLERRDLSGPSSTLLSQISNPSLALESVAPLPVWYQATHSNDICLSLSPEECYEQTGEAHPQFFALTDKNFQESRCDEFLEEYEEEYTKRSKEVSSLTHTFATEYFGHENFYCSVQDGCPTPPRITEVVEYIYRHHKNLSSRAKVERARTVYFAWLKLYSVGKLFQTAYRNAIATQLTVGQNAAWIIQTLTRQTDDAAVAKCHMRKFIRDMIINIVMVAVSEAGSAFPAVMSFAQGLVKEAQKAAEDTVKVAEGAVKAAEGTVKAVEGTVKVSKWAQRMATFADKQKWPGGHLPMVGSFTNFFPTVKHAAEEGRKLNDASIERHREKYSVGGEADPNYQRYLTINEKVQNDECATDGDGEGTSDQDFERMSQMDKHIADMFEELKHTLVMIFTKLDWPDQSQSWHQAQNGTSTLTGMNNFANFTKANNHGSSRSQNQSQSQDQDQDQNQTQKINMSGFAKAADAASVQYIMEGRSIEQEREYIDTWIRYLESTAMASTQTHIICESEFQHNRKGQTPQQACDKNEKLACPPEDPDTVCKAHSFSLNKQKEEEPYGVEHFQEHGLTQRNISLWSYANYKEFENGDFSPQFHYSGKGGIRLGPNRSAMSLPVCRSPRSDSLSDRYDNFPCTCEDPKTKKVWTSGGLRAFLWKMAMQVGGKHWLGYEEDKLLRSICPWKHRNDPPLNVALMNCGLGIRYPEIWDHGYAKSASDGDLHQMRYVKDDGGMCEALQLRAEFMDERIANYAFCEWGKNAPKGFQEWAEGRWMRANQKPYWNEDIMAKGGQYSFRFTHTTWGMCMDWWRSMSNEEWDSLRKEWIQWNNTDPRAEVLRTTWPEWTEAHINWTIKHTEHDV